MNDLIIKGEREAYTAPNVEFYAKTGHMLISGESFLEETAEFYSPLVIWVSQYISETTLNNITFDIKLEYFNTSTSKWLLRILTTLKEFEEQRDGKITINWYYDADDVDMLDEIEDYEEDAELEINRIEF